MTCSMRARTSRPQPLFEGGHITYHRTDNPNISEEDFAHVEALAKAMGWAMAPKLRTFKAPEAAQAGHPAITPTHWEVDEAGDTDEAKAVYRLIRQRAIARPPQRNWPSTAKRR